MTPWEQDVATAVQQAYRGQSENWPMTARVLATEVTELRSKLFAAEQHRLADLADALAGIPDPGYETQVPHGV